MSQFGLPDPNDNVLEERIKWDSMPNWERKRSINEAPNEYNFCYSLGFPINKLYDSLMLIYQTIIY